jgi:enamine deaminase RidA (YjgF/YER057c/UK114 family)
MAEVIEFGDGGFRFIKGVLPYSAGVAAQAGFAIERARFTKVLPLAEGYAAIAAHLNSIGRPLTALCACELRSPAPFTDEGFGEFNREYIKTLTEWKLYRDGINPVARSNLAPAVNPPKVPGFHAFSYTVPATDSRKSFVIAGSGEAPEGKANYRDHIVRKGDVSPEGLREKARWVLGEQERRQAALGFSWRDVVSTQVYTVHDIHPLVASEFAARGADAGGLTWHYVRPPVVDLEYEMDCRGVFRELVL